MLKWSAGAALMLVGWVAIIDPSTRAIGVGALLVGLVLWFRK